MAEKDLTTQLTELLRTLQSTTPGVMGAGIISVDGFAIASELPQSVEERRVAAMAAAMLALGEQTTAEFEHGHLARVFVEGGDGYTIIMNAGPEAVLSVVARKDSKLGLVFLQMERAADGVRKAMA
ncbi:MAG: roadblock/LC7 domain-containing protein [Chloroflexi bacterium]|nr:roadblock/LC7 domain-containing protein [Chloroflexota bacterium]